MKQKQILVATLLLVCVSLLFSGCSSLQSPTCVEDNFCALNEKTRGGCSDCLPDFSIQQDTMVAYYDQNNDVVRAQVCVVNKQGEYTDGVQVNWGLSSTKEWKGESQKQWVYFDAPDVQGSFSVNARKGGIDQWSSLQFANAQEQVNCFSYDFYDVESAPYYYVLFQINGDQIVEEKSYDNNYQWYYAEGRVAQYPAYLVEEDFGSLELSYAYGGYSGTWYTESGNELPYTYYYAGYYTENSNPSNDGNVYVHEFESAAAATSVLNAYGVTTVNVPQPYVAMPMNNGAVVYSMTGSYKVLTCEKDGYSGTWYGFENCPDDYTQTDSYVTETEYRLWTSKNKLIYLFMSNGNMDDIGLFQAYIDLHPSTSFGNTTPAR